MSHLINFVRRALIGYEPVVAAQIVAAFFTLCSGLGIAVGDLPEKVNAVLVFVGVIAPLIAGAYSRAKVTPYVEPPVEVAPEVVPMTAETPADDPADDFAPEPGQHKRKD